MKCDLKQKECILMLKITLMKRTWRWSLSCRLVDHLWSNVLAVFSTDLFHRHTHKRQAFLVEVGKD